MTNAQFFLYLGVTTAIAALCAWAAHALLPIGYALPLTLAAFPILLGLTVALFFLGKRTAGAENKFLFGNIFMGATMVKMFICGGLMVAYSLIAKPSNNLFVVPFFTTYFAYTIYEVVFLVIEAGAAQAKEKKKREDDEGTPL